MSFKDPDIQVQYGARHIETGQVIETPDVEQAQWLVRVSEGFEIVHRTVLPWAPAPKSLSCQHTEGWEFDQGSMTDTCRQCGTVRAS